MGINTKAIRQALYERLNTASVTTNLAAGSASLFHAIAPAGAQLPYVIFNKQSGVPTLRMGGNAFDSQLWLVKAVTRSTSSSVAEDIANAIDARLDFGDLTISGGHLLHLARESDVDYVETDGDQTYRHHGGLFRVIAAAQ